MNVARRVAVASAYAILQRVLLRVIGLGSTLILVRLLSPEDFGIVALAATVQATMESLSNLSFGLALIRMREPQREHYDTAFTLGLMRAAFIAGGLIATADLQASFMGDARIAPVMYVQAVAVMLQAFESIRMVDLQRELRFDTLMRYAVLQKLIGLSIALPFAFWQRNYWALVVAIPLNWLVMVPISYRIAPHRPRLSLKAWRELFGFSKWLLVGNLCHVVEGQIMTVVLGRFVGMTGVGLYNVAFQIAALPITELAVPIRAPSYAGFARMRENPAELRRQVLGALALQALLIAPLSIGIALTANEVTLIFLGERWRDLVPLMWIIALFALCDALAGYTHQLLIVLGRQGLYLIIYAAIVAARAAAVIGGGWNGGLLGAAHGMLAVSVLNVVVWIAVTARLIGLGPRALFEAFARSAAGAIAMSAAVLAMPANTAAALGLTVWPVTTTLLLKAAVGATVYCSVVLALWKAARMPADSAEAHVLRTLGEGAARFRRRLA